VGPYLIRVIAVYHSY